MFPAGPWTIFAPTNEAFMNLPMTYLENMIQNPEKLSKLVLNHMINKTIFKAGLKSHQEVRMANGNTLNLYARPGKENEIFVSLLVIIASFKVQLPEKTTT